MISYKQNFKSQLIPQLNKTTLKGINMTVTTTIKTNHSILTRESFLEARDGFREFVKAPKNKPTRCETYGTKYPGNVFFIHFGFYAVLRGKPVSSVTHSIDSERYQEMISILKSPYGYRRIQSAFPTISEEQFLQLIAQHRKW